MPGTPCLAYHPAYDSCITYPLHLIIRAFKSLFPVYISLNMVPALIFKPKQFFKNPTKYLERIITNSLRSTCFIGTYLGMFQSGMCLFYNLFPLKSNKYYTFLLGGVCGTSILLEQKSKRSELAMYSFPFAINSVYLIMMDHGKMFKIPYFDVVLCSASFSVLMGLYQIEPNHMSPFLYKIMKAVIGEY